MFSDSNIVEQKVLGVRFQIDNYIEVMGFIANKLHVNSDDTKYNEPNAVGRFLEVHRWPK